MTHLKAIVFDWAGTVVDFGSLCPVGALQAAFMSKGIQVTPKDINRFMGIHKREHVRAVLSLPANTAQWERIFGAKPDQTDVDTLHGLAEQKMLETVDRHAKPTPHLLDAMVMVRKNGLKVGSTTGYISPLMERLVPAAKRQGFSPDFWVASDQVPQGRPWPWMIYKNMEYLGIYPPAAVVKIGDTVADIGEAINAGAWSVGVVESGSLISKSETDWNNTPTKERNALIRQASEYLVNAGAHFIIGNLSELEAVLDQIETRMDKGQLPPNLARHRRNAAN